MLNFALFLRRVFCPAMCFLLWFGPVSALDLRIVFVDTGHFAAIPSGSERRAAIAEMSNQLRVIEKERAAKSILLIESGSSIERFQGLNEGSTIAGQPAFQKLLNDMEKGKGEGTAGFELVDLHNKAFQFLKNADVIQTAPILTTARRLIGLGTAWKPTSKSVSIHIFAQDWVTEEDDPNGNVVEFDRTASCVLEERNITRLIPSYVDLAFDFRPPLGGKIVSEAGMSSLISVVSGSAVKRDNILTYGSTAPFCTLGAATAAEPWQSPKAAPNSCTKAEFERKTITPCSNAPKFPGIAGVLEPLPVHIVTDPGPAGIERLGVSARGPVGSFTVLAHVDRITLAPGGAPVVHGLAPSRYPVQLELNSAPGCTPGNGFDLRLGDLSGADRALGIVVSRHYCQSLSLPLPELDLK